MNEKLDKLVSMLSIHNRYNQVMSADDFELVEQRLSIQIPQDYKYFCKTLGSGRLAEFVDIYCMTDSLILANHNIAETLIESINYWKQERKSTLSDIEYRKYYGDRDDDSYIKLVNSSLVFGIYNGECAVFWDLRTYNSDDNSYDIYWYDINAPHDEIPIKIGRIFTEFICDFCYGQIPCQLIPDVFPESSREIIYSFLGHEW
jgi:SMI1 / KNR4 family (SUKH-1)